MAKSPFIFNGQYAKNLLSFIRVQSLYDIITGTADPTAVAQPGNAGSLYVRTGGTPRLYQKQDAGTTTNWSLFSTTSTSAAAIHEVPAGVVDGVNANFTLTQTPINLSSLLMFIDGIEVTPTGYSLAGMVVTFGAGFIPVPGQAVTAFYIVPSVAGIGSIAWQDEAPAGAVNGVNVTFTLSLVPADTSTLNLYQNGLHLHAPTHYSLAGSTITMVAAPAPGSDLWANYRKT